MRSLSSVLLFVTCVLGGAGGGYYYARHVVREAQMSTSVSAAAKTCSQDHALYFRDPSGAPFWSAKPKTNAAGQSYLPVCEDDSPSFEPQANALPSARAGKILYYRNPMGLPDVSPTPKKDSMGMDYIPVYENESAGDDTAIKISLGRVQRSGVRSEVAEARVVVTPVRAVGSVKYDERRLTIITMRSEGYIEDLFVATTGQDVNAGEPLFRVYSREIQLAQVDLGIAIAADKRGLVTFGQQSVEGAMQRLRNLGVPESRIQEVRKHGGDLRTLDWPTPSTGTVIEKKIINGQRVMAGDELYRIADLSHMWIIAEVAEADIGMVKIGATAEITLRAYPNQPIIGNVAFIYPDLRPETRTVRVRIEAPNPDRRLKVDMYADVVIRTGADSEPVVAVPDSAVIDSGTRRIVLVDKGEGRFEPREVTTGRRGDGFVEILGGVAEGESIVTTATFLIDAESNLNAALKAFSTPEKQQ